MKSTDAFKETIKKYLDDRVVFDPLFIPFYKREDKNIDDCVMSILTAVHKSGSNGFTDDEIYSLAVHYYQEDNVEIDASVSNMKVVVNHHVKLTEEEITEAKEQAMKQAINEQRAAMTKRAAKPVVKQPESQQSLF